MVICKYFQTGNCRFGSKCVNEHFDIKQYIKTEVEAALKGSQWPLSCFGIFKEKPCIPNFIEDQSYEEIRCLCYKARKENYFPAFEQQFTQQVLDAQNKMKTLLTLSREVVEAVIKLYDDAELAQKGGQHQHQHQQHQQQHQQQQHQQQHPSNPFSLGSSALGQTNSSGLFGSSAAQSHPFSSPNPGFSGPAVSSASIFGGHTTTPSGGLLGQTAFGSSGFAGGNQNSIFGGQQTSTFSLTQLGQQSSSAAQGGNIFSMNPQQTQGAPGGSVFGGSVQQPQQQQQQQSPFASSNVFGGNTGQTSLFAQQTQPQPAQQPISGGNLFSQPTQPTGTAGPFSQPQSSFGVQQSTGLFGQQQQSQQLLQQPQPQPQQFQMQAQPQSQQQGGQSLFGAPQQPTAFSQPQSSGPGPFGEPQPAGLLTANQQQNAAGAFFGAPNQVQQGLVGFGPMQSSAAPQTVQSAPAAVYSNDTTYSKMENLSPEEIEAFRANEFVLGKIPTNPPPRELIH